MILPMPILVHLVLAALSAICLLNSFGFGGEIERLPLAASLFFALGSIGIPIVMVLQGKK